MTMLTVTLAVGDKAMETLTVNAVDAEAAAPIRRLSAREFMQLNPDEQRDYERRLDYYRDLERWAEYRRKYPITTASAKERPSCRRWIVSEDLRPYPSSEIWDGMSATRPGGEHTFLSDGLPAQMRRMLLEGYWGTKAAGTIILRTREYDAIRTNS